MTQEQIINQIVSKYLSQVEICSSVEEQIIDVEIEVDGNISIENAEKLHNLGAKIFVSGSSSLFQNTEMSVTEIIKKMRKVI